MADVVLPAVSSWCEAEGTVTNSERRVQRVRKALEPPAMRATSSGSSRRLPSAWGTTGARQRRNRRGTKCEPWRPEMFGGMTYARLEALGGIQWPCPDESHPGSPSLHARLWDAATSAAGPRPFSVVVHERPVEMPDD